MTDKAPTQESPLHSQAAQATDVRTIDKDVNAQFWARRAAKVDNNDPRVVTLDRSSAASVAREVQLYQQWMMRRLKGRPLDTVVDLGCGNGDWSIMLARHARRTIATDLTAELVETVRKRAAVEVPGKLVECSAQDMASYPFDEPVDLIVAGGVLQYISDDDCCALLGRAAAALRPRKGVFYLRATVAKGAERRAKCDDAYQAIYRSIDWYHQAMRDAGLTVTDGQLATDFVADELGKRWLGPAGPALGWPLRLVRRAYRGRRSTDVYACLAVAA